jgi:hypothetical protein
MKFLQVFLKFQLSYQILNKILIFFNELNILIYYFFIKKIEIKKSFLKIIIHIIIIFINIY